ncbi:hypothetical protein BDZ91DRAFT_102572 [Kalaharituber pfeilii]|nr:hypothetical protein BDZ91DRAFT_102572 [Kalaharituber pfeilii]
MCLLDWVQEQARAIAGRMSIIRPPKVVCQFPPYPCRMRGLWGGLWVVSAESVCMVIMGLNPSVSDGGEVVRGGRLGVGHPSWSHRISMVDPGVGSRVAPRTSSVKCLQSNLRITSQSLPCLFRSTRTSIHSLSGGGGESPRRGGGGPRGFRPLLGILLAGWCGSW